MLRQIGSMHPDPVNPDLTWLRSAYEQIKCQSCNFVNRSYFPNPLDVVLSRDPAHRVSSHIFRTGIKIYHRKLIDAIRPYLTGFALGTCRLPGGEILHDYLTCYARTFFVPRGDRGANYYICNACGTISLNTGGQEYQFVLKKDLTDAMVYQNASTWLYLREELASSIDWSQWPDACIEDVKVIDKPYDPHRLPGDPDWQA